MNQLLMLTATLKQKKIEDTVHSDMHSAQWQSHAVINIILFLSCNIILCSFIYFILIINTDIVLICINCVMGMYF